MRKAAEPIKCRRKIQEIINDLREQDKRIYLAFVIGIHTGLRPGDIINLRVKDVLEKGRPKDTWVISPIKNRGRKRHNVMRVPISPRLQAELKNALRDLHVDAYIISRHNKGEEPLSVRMLTYFLNQRAWGWDLESLSASSLRKTFAYHLYHKTKCVVTVSKALGHSRTQTTDYYMGITAEKARKAVMELW